MKETVAELLGSKRFLVVTLCVLVCAAFVLTGHMPLQGDPDHLGFFDAFTKLSALLATLYGLENAATAFRPKGDAPVIGTVLTTDPMKVEPRGTLPEIPPPPAPPAVKS